MVGINRNDRDMLRFLWLKNQYVPRSDMIHLRFCRLKILLSTYPDGHVETRLVAAKTRVAPIKSQTIPRLELLGAVISARLSNTITRSLPNNDEIECMYWTDSTTTLQWIQSDKRWRQYVQQRVQEIRQLTPKERWRHCPGNENPSDLPSRGLSAEDLIDNKLWLEGSEFLKKPELAQRRTYTREIDESSLKELVKPAPHITYSFVNIGKDSTYKDVSQVIDCSNLSSLKKLLRVTAYVLRFIRRFRSKQDDIATTKELNASEICHAETCWIKGVQMETYEHEIRQVRLSGTTPLVKQFELYIDENKILCCEGRIHNSTIAETAKRPILLPTKHHFMNLVIHESHNINVHHNGTRETLNAIREKFWIPRGQEVVKQIVRRCVVCKKIEGKVFKSVKAPPLSACRVSEDPPFSNTGIDFAGPLYVKDESKQKTYICLYTCASTRAIHLELTENLSVRTFLLAFRRFTSRREVPTRLLSDNVKTFKAAAKEVKLILRSEEKQRYFATKGVTWQFIIEKAP